MLTIQSFYIVFFCLRWFVCSRLGGLVLFRDDGTLSLFFIELTKLVKSEISALQREEIMFFLSELVHDAFRPYADMTEKYP